MGIDSIGYVNSGYIAPQRVTARNYTKSSPPFKSETAQTESNKQEKGISSGAKLLIGTALLAVAGGFLFCLTKGKKGANRLGKVSTKAGEAVADIAKTGEKAGGVVDEASKVGKGATESKKPINLNPQAQPQAQPSVVEKSTQKAGDTPSPQSIPVAHIEPELHKPVVPQANPDVGFKSEDARRQAKKTWAMRCTEEDIALEYRENFQKDLNKRLGVEQRVEFTAGDSWDNFQALRSNQSEAVLSLFCRYPEYKTGKNIPSYLIDSCVHNAFLPVNKIVTFADGTQAKVIYEGLDIDITDTGALLKKIFTGNKTEYTNVTKQICAALDSVSSQVSSQVQQTHGRLRSTVLA